MKPLRPAVQRGSREAARRLFAISRPTEGTLVETLLAPSRHCRTASRWQSALSTPLLLPWTRRTLASRNLAGDDRLRHGSRWHASPGYTAPGSIPTALIPIGSARRRSTRHDVRWGICSAMRFVSASANDVLVAGEGIETMLSLRYPLLPTMPMAAALSANHLAAMLLPQTLRRLYIARDADLAGEGAASDLDDARRSSRHRGVHLVARAWRLQRGPAHARR